ncbi:MAG TPA: outer membrane beta-barrel protein [Kofleriaceae bacterium]|nr:outer membrane beta-barrel protein [Kofleriaceae bacterium]
MASPAAAQEAPPAQPAEEAPPAGEPPPAEKASPAGEPPPAEQTPPAGEPPPADLFTPPPDAVPLAPSSAEDRITALEAENQALREELEILGDDLRYLEERQNRLAPLAGKVSGYLDFGFFTVTGDGSGIRADTSHTYFPEYGPPPGETESIVPGQWVFYGDPLSTAINARGEPATTGQSRAVVFDSVGTDKASFIVNTLNLGLTAEVGDRLIFTGKLDVVPRTRNISDAGGLFLGDFVDLRLAYLEYRIPRESVNLSLFAGKFDSVVGFEYRTQEAPTRIEVTPSLICRYTCGYPLGVKARALFLDEALAINVAVSNGSSFSEIFPFYNEVDSNHFKTISGRLSYAIQAAGELEVGVSGVFGAQDLQSEEDIYQWQVGADAHYHRHDLVVRGEYVQGRARGRSDPAQAARCGLVPCLEFKGAYGLVGYRVSNLLMPYARVDWRDALHEAGASFVYISRLIRGTGGLRLTINEHLILKGEYTVNRELGRAPQFPNDVFTSALVVTY